MTEQTPDALISEIPVHFPARETGPTSKVPRYIYQTFKTQQVPEKMLAATRSWIALNPEYEYVFFDDAACFALVTQFDCSDFTFSPADLQKAYVQIKPGAGKADVFRYLLIYQRGGVYMDVDTYCARPIRTFVHPDDDVVSGIGSRGDLHQWGLIYSPRHSFMKRTIENAVRNILDRQFVPGYEGSLEGLAGPPCLDLSIKQVLGLPLEARFRPGLYDVQINERTSRIRILEKDLFGHNVGFKYENYAADLSKVGLVHWSQETLFNDA